MTILFAIESGSRAWGFSSRDSDFDLRFVYVRPLDWYLSLSRRRDVIERPIVGDLDINGWDVKKALTLLNKGHPVLLEWLSSPIIYVERPETALLRAFAERIDHRQAVRSWPRCIRHCGARPFLPRTERQTSMTPSRSLPGCRKPIGLASCRVASLQTYRPRIVP